MSTQKVPLKGFLKQSFNMIMKGNKLTNATMPISFMAGEQNPIKQKKTINNKLTASLGRAMKKLK